MLTTADKEKLKTTLKGFDVDKLIAAITDAAEVAIEIPADTHVLSASDLDARTTNDKADAKKEGFKEGKTAGIEIAGKAIAKKFNLADTVDVKEPDKIAEAISATVAKGDDGLKEQIKLLQKDKEALTAEKETIAKEKDAVQFDTTLISMFPATRTQDLSDGERLMLVKNALQFDTVDGVQVVKKNGEILRDPTTKNPLPQKAAVAALFAERKWDTVPAQGGRGGGDNPGGSGSAGGVKTFSDAQKKWQTENPNGNIISPEATNYIAAIAKDVTDFDWHN